MSTILSFKLIPKHYQAALVAWTSRIILGVVQFFTVSITLNLLGIHLYAVYAIIIGLQGWFNLLDYGLSSSLQNSISAYQAENKSIQPLLANAALMIISLLVISCLLFVLLAPFLQHLLFYRIAPELADSERYILLSVGIIFIITALLSISYRVRFALHQGSWAYFYQSFGLLLSMLGLLVIKYIGLSHYRLIIVLLVGQLPPLLIALINYCQCFPCKNLFMFFTKSILHKLLSLGVRFWLFNLAGALTLFIDYIVMSQTLPAHEIAVYNILSKGYSLMFFFYDTLLFAIWPEISELYFKKEWGKANAMLLRNLRLGIIFIIFGTLAVWLGKTQIMELLRAPSGLTLPVSTIFLFGIYFIIRIWTDTYSVALQSQNFLKVFCFAIPIQAIISATGMWFFSLHFGLNGILYGLLASFLLTVVWLLPVVYYKRKVLYAL
ncbi:MAG: MATE family efflux transporter [Gammaproteobacteria bacterium]|nr:MATE family efflux transporter [Gammaproteobacteria bacterium]